MKSLEQRSPASFIVWYVVPATHGGYLYPPGWEQSDLSCHQGGWISSCDSHLLVLLRLCRSKMQHARISGSVRMQKVYPRAGLLLAPADSGISGIEIVLF